jgi:hypothetical protein
MSKQHVFPERLERFFPRVEGPKSFRSWSRITKRGKVIKHTRKVRKQTGSMTSVKLRRVCRPCNQGWLNTMEQDCVPVLERLIEGQLSVLTPLEQTKLARVATSIAMVGEWCHLDYLRTPQSDRERFRQTLYPPPTWFVFIGRNKLGAEQPKFYSDGLEVNDLNVPPEFVSFTIVIDVVVLHILCVREDLFINVDEYASSLRLAAICPTTDRINFSIMPELGADDIALIRAYAGMAYRYFMQGK